PCTDVPATPTMECARVQARPASAPENCHGKCPSIHAWADFRATSRTPRIRVIVVSNSAKISRNRLARKHNRALSGVPRAFDITVPRNVRVRATIPGVDEAFPGSTLQRLPLAPTGTAEHSPRTVKVAGNKPLPGAKGSLAPPGTSGTGNPFEHT